MAPLIPISQGGARLPPVGALWVTLQGVLVDVLNKLRFFPWEEALPKLSTDWFLGATICVHGVAAQGWRLRFLCMLIMLVCATQAIIRVGNISALYLVLSP